MKTIAIVQARMGSKRLPGKIIMPIGGKTIVEHILSSLKKCKRISTIYLATGSGAENDPLKPLAEKLNVNFFKGPEDNVLDRFWQVLELEKKQKKEYQHIVRICADSPFIDYKEVDNLIKAHHKAKADLSINYNHPTGLPCGFGVEVISYNALKESHQFAETDEHREHLDEWILQHPNKYQILQVPITKSKQCYHINFSIDTQDDFNFVNALVQKNKPTNDNYYEPKHLLKTLRKNPLLTNLKKLKLFVRADGDGEIGMGHIIRSHTICQEMKAINPKLEVIYFSNEASIPTLKDFGYNAYQFSEELFKQKTEEIQPDIIITDLRKHLDDISSENLNRALKIRFIDTEKSRTVRGNLIFNSFPLKENINQNAVYHAGFQYLPLRKEFQKIKARTGNEPIKNILIMPGGGEHTPQVLKLLNLTNNFPQQHFTFVLGPGTEPKSKEHIEHLAKTKKNATILHNIKNVKELMDQSQLGISGGGNTLLEFARCRIPTLCLSSDYDKEHQDHQQYYCRAFHQANTSIYIGHSIEWSDNLFTTTLKELIQNSKKRENMIKHCKEIAPGNATRKIGQIILQEYVRG